MERAYETSVSVRFVVSGETATAADQLAESFATQLAAWIDGSLGSPPFAPWLTAYVTEPPTELAKDPAAWPLRRVTSDELAAGRLWT